VPGTCASSFGIHVAQMAGMPNEIVVKAKMLLEQLESKSINDKGRIREDINSVQASSALQMQLFDDSNKLWLQIKGEIEKLDLGAMTPIECMLKLKEIQVKLNEEQ
jgi:DNA mismatch repair protein MutS